MTKRWMLIAPAALALAAAPPPRPAAPAKAVVVLTANGLAIGGMLLRFGAPRAAAIAAVSAARGAPIRQQGAADCGGADPVATAFFAGGLSIAFVKGRFSGWTDDDKGALRTTRGLANGASVAALKKAYPSVSLDPGDEANGGLGPSFQIEGEVAGWLSGVKPANKVTGMFAGATCLSGV